MEAGHLSSIPYIIASFTTPLFGSLVTKLGEKSYELLMIISLIMILVVNLSLLLINDAIDGQSPTNLIVTLTVLFGIGHAMFAIIETPCIK